MSVHIVIRSKQNVHLPARQMRVWDAKLGPIARESGIPILAAAGPVCTVGVLPDMSLKSAGNQQSLPPEANSKGSIQVLEQT